MKRSEKLPRSSSSEGKLWPSVENRKKFPDLLHNRDHGARIIQRKKRVIISEKIKKKLRESV